MSTKNNNKFLAELAEARKAHKLNLLHSPAAMKDAMRRASLEHKLNQRRAGMADMVHVKDERNEQ